MKTALTTLCAISVLGIQFTCAGDEVEALKKAVTLYASFDEAVRGDFGGGDLTVSTRTNHPTKKGEFVFKKGFDDNVFTIAKDKGVSGGCLDVTNIIDDNGRIFFPAKGNIAYKKSGWAGSVSVWINTDPNKLLVTPFCDPVQITQKGANNGGIWFDFNNNKPRDLRMGVFPAVPAGKKGASESDEDAPMVRVPRVLFKQGDWHHVVLTWDHFDTGNDPAKAILYINGKKIGQVKDRPIAMDWDIEKTGIYIAVNFIGFLDEFAVFNRALTMEEVGLLHRQAGILASLKKK